MYFAQGCPALVRVRLSSARVLRTAALVVTALVAASVPSSALAFTTTPGVIPPNASPHGMSYAQWSAAWWQFDLGLPVHDPANPTIIKNPQFVPGDPAQVDCSFGQQGHVWFLQGHSNSGVAHRSCAIPSGTILFLPIIDAWADNSNYDGQPPSTNTEAQLRALIAPLVDSITSMSATIDGRPISGLDVPASSGYHGPYRVASPVFSYTVGPDNWLNYTAPPGFTFSAQTVTGAVADGVYLMLAPLSVGSHVIHWTASGGGLLQDITYTLTVVPR
jgi:hypothetical protein